MSTKTKDLTKYDMTKELQSKFETNALATVELVFEATLEAKDMAVVPSQNAFKLGVRNATDGLGVKASNMAIETMYNLSVVDGKTKAEALTAIGVAYKTEALAAAQRRLDKTNKANAAKQMELDTQAAALKASLDASPKDPTDVPAPKDSVDVPVTIGVDLMTKELGRILKGSTKDLRKGIESLIARLALYTEETTTTA